MNKDSEAEVENEIGISGSQNRTESAAAQSVAREAQAEEKKGETTVQGGAPAEEKQVEKLSKEQIEKLER